MSAPKQFQTLSNTDAAYIAGFIDGEGTVTLTRKHRNENRQALALLENTLPFLRSYKRDRAKLILRDYLTVTPRNGKYTVDVLARKKEFEQIVLSIKANS